MSRIFGRGRHTSVAAACSSVLPRAKRAVAWRLVGATVTAVAILPVAHAVAAPHVVVWSGALTPGSPAQGVELRANGTGRRLTGDASGAQHVTGSFTPGGSRLAAIRAAASKLLSSGPSVTHAGARDGGYVSVLLEDGAKRRAVVDTGADSAAVAALLKAFNATLPKGSRLLGASFTGAVAASVRVAPTATPCPAGQNATDVVKNLPMADAAASGLVQLSPKGSFGGDSIAVDGTWKPIKAPATVTVHLEITRAADDATTWAPLVKGKLDAAYAGYKVDGQPVTFNFDVVDKGPGPARACYHEILMHIPNDVRSYVSDLGPAAQGGEWSAPDARAWAHEVGHLIGVDDHYNDYFHSSKTGANVKLPSNGLEGDALQAALPAGIKASDGRLFSKPWKGYESDLMATGKGRLRQTDLKSIVAGADIAVHDNPGDVLLNKNGADQNMVTGAPFDLRIPKGKTAHVDGMVAYCIDLTKHVPGASGHSGFDPLGPAGALGTESMVALQRVVDVVAARQPGPLQATPGANDAIWRVSDDSDVGFDASATAILQAAGVPVAVADKTYAAPHFADPNAASPQTQALNPAGGTLPGLPAPQEGVLPPANTTPTLSALQVQPRRLRAPAGRGRTFIGAQLTVDGAPDQVSIALVRTRRGRTVTVAQGPAQPVAIGQALLSLVARGLTPGAYQLVIRDATGHRLQGAVTVTRGRKVARKGHRRRKK